MLTFFVIMAMLSVGMIVAASEVPRAGNTYGAEIFRLLVLTAGIVLLALVCSGIGGMSKERILALQQIEASSPSRGEETRP